MAGAAIRTELAIVRIILLVAGGTIPAGRFEISNRPGAGVAPATVHPGVFAGQVEGGGAVVKFVAISVDPIVTAQAVVRVDLEVGLHKISIDLLVTGSADGLIELAVAIYVTGVTSKRCTIRLVWVGYQRIPKGIMRDIYFSHVGQGNCRPTMIRVTVSASQTWIVL
jgi:hypothetical protein